MICDTTQRSAAVLSKIANLAGAVREDWRQLFDRLTASATDPGFPGGLVPIATPAGGVRVYALASDDRQWRQLRPLLLCFAGPTLTSFNGLPATLSGTDAIEKVLAEADPSTVGILDLPSDDTIRAQGLRALVRLVTVWSRAPAMDGKPSEPTSWLLADFQDQINVGRREAAWSVVRRLEDELRLDALNIRFLEVQLFAAFEDWQAIVAMRGLKDLCNARRPPSVTNAIMEALYRVKLASAFDAEDLDTLLSAYERECRPMAQSLIVLPPRAVIGDAALRISAIEAIIDGDRSDISKRLRSRSEAIGWLAAHLGSAEGEVPSPVPSPNALDDARIALAKTDGLSPLEQINALWTTLRALPPDQLDALRGAEPFKSVLRELAPQGVPSALPANWIEWLERVHEPGFGEALAIARRGKDEWSIGDAEADPANVARLRAALAKVEEGTIAGDRAIDALPLMVAWLQRDPDFPRASFQPIYSMLLTMFAIGSRRGRPIYESTGLLTKALLSVGLATDVYKDLLGDVSELMGSGLGAESVYWLLDIVEETLRFPAPDAEARLSFWHSGLARIEPLRSRLNALQRASLAELAGALGWSTETVDAIVSTTSPDSARVVPSGLRIAIYTLTEAVSRQAKVVLEKTLPSAVVDCSADHGGSRELKAMAENADIFVIVALSAKHAATDFIRSHRGKRPLLYAQGHGFTSILRCIDEFLSKT
ncbi:protein DpdD [Bradyrhizobium sp. CB1015]|uniref:protein DpdD n=1 Tax=Bradyrhizobium sp. CB1015 TaxID=2976822 RepID=UPI0021AAD01E|nr:protein DpdD [Bradyrhizobium sp. CB1015]UWU92951.1 protein DpdD [Bradyrhizobium sp. CB1015]